jgi:hypothetical protein
MLHPVPQARQMIKNQAGISMPASSDRLVPQILSGPPLFHLCAGAHGWRGLAFNILAAQ